MILEPPEPTAPPDLRVLARRLQERQLTATTCGYVNGNISSPVTCSFEEFCYSNTAQKVHGCCILDECFPPTTCLDSTAVITACNITCLDDLSTAKCTGGSNSYCYTQTWNDGYLQYGCAPSPFQESVYTTHTGSAAITSGTSSPGSGSQGTSPTSTGTSPISSTPAATSSHITLSTGAITGICLGGCVVLAMITAWLRRNKTDDKKPPPTDNNPPQSPPPAYTATPLTRSNLGGRGSIELRPWDSASQLGGSNVGFMRDNYHNPSYHQSFVPMNYHPSTSAYTRTAISSMPPSHRPDLYPQ